MTTIPPSPAVEQCIAQASASYQIAESRIRAILSAVAARAPVAGRVGVMGVPESWAPLFGLYGIDASAMANDTCQNIILGTWILSYSDQIAQWRRGYRSAYTPQTVYARLATRRRRWAPLIAEASRQTGVPIELIHAIMTVESGYNERAISRAGAIGLMQLMPATARRLGVNPRNPVENLYGGAKYLNELMWKFHGDAALTIAAYNSGSEAVVRYGYRVPPFHETMAYVPKVLSVYTYLIRHEQQIAAAD